MSTALIAVIALGTIMIIAVVVILRWAWNARYNEGEARAEAEVVEEAAKAQFKRKTRAQEERAKTNRDWIDGGRK